MRPLCAWERIWEKKILQENSHRDAHVLTIWSEVCSWTEEDVEKLSNRFQGWIANSHMWLSPSLWVPRDQARMDNLCNASPGCWPGGQFFNATKLDWKIGSSNIFLSRRCLWFGCLIAWKLVIERKVRKWCTYNNRWYQGLLHLIL